MFIKKCQSAAFLCISAVVFALITSVVLVEGRADDATMSAGTIAQDTLAERNAARNAERDRQQRELAERNAARNAERDRLHREQAERAARQRQEWAEREAAQRQEREDLADRARLEQQERQAAQLREKLEQDCHLDGGLWSADAATCSLSEEAQARRQARVRAEGERQLQMIGAALGLLFDPAAGPEDRPLTSRERCLRENPTNLGCF